MNSSLKFRAPNLNDAEEINSIVSMPKFIHGTSRLPYRRLDETREWLSSLGPDNTAILALLDGKIVGSADIRRAKGRRSHCGAIGIGIHDDFHGQGIGTALMGQIVDVADNWLGLKRLELTVYSDNKPAIRLYEKYGFEREGLLRSYAFRAGQYVDVLTMARLCF